MGKIRFERPTGQMTVDQLADAVERAFEKMGNMAGSKDLGEISLTTSETTIPHGLKHVPNGYAIRFKGSSGAATVYESTDRDEKNLYLTASSSVTAEIEVW